MKTFTRDYRITGGSYSAYDRYFSGLRSCVLDIETTGLSYANSKVILVGLLTNTESSVKVTQFLAENHYEENKVLEATLGFLEKEETDFLITYNGRAFDLPFLNSRLERIFYGDEVRKYNFDLFSFLKSCTDLKTRIGSLSQKSVENYYGILDERGDTISGRESVIMFNEYSLSGNSTLEKIILTHNREDVLHLHRLMQLAANDADDIDAAMAGYGFPIMGGRFSISPSLCRTGRGKSSQYILRINGEQYYEPVSAVLFPDMYSPLSAEFSSGTRMFRIEFPVNPAPEEIPGADGIFYLDTKTARIDLSDDPDCVNDFLILYPRSINLAARLITENVVNTLNK